MPICILITPKKPHLKCFIHFRFLKSVAFATYFTNWSFVCKLKLTKPTKRQRNDFVLLLVFFELFYIKIIKCFLKNIFLFVKFEVLVVPLIILFWKFHHKHKHSQLRLVLWFFFQDDCTSGYTGSCHQLTLIFNMILCCMYTWILLVIWADFHQVFLRLNCYLILI